jgi:hypothetical protein
MVLPLKSKKYAYNNNYKGKSPMTRTQWRRYQRSKNGVAVSLEDKTTDPSDGKRMVESGRRPAKERLSPPLIKEDPDEDDELGSKFIVFEPAFDVICNVVSILPAEYDMVSKSRIQKKSLIPMTWRNKNPCATL